jgi:hypothetical protein
MVGCPFGVACLKGVSDSPAAMVESAIFMEYQTVRPMIGEDLEREMTAA